MIWDADRSRRWLGPVVDLAGSKGYENLEMLLLLAGLKPAVKLEDLTTEARLNAMRVAADNGLAVREVTQTNAPSTKERGLGEDSRVLTTLFLARDTAVVERLVMADAAQRQGGSSRVAAIFDSGRLLGYPDCCVRFFAELPTQTDRSALDEYLHSGRATPCQNIRYVETEEPLMNIFPPDVSPVTWFPCSFQCEAATRYALKVLDALKGKASKGIREMRRRLSGLTLVSGRFTFVHLGRVTQKGDWFDYEEVSDALSFSTESVLVESTVVAEFRREVSQVFAAYRRFRITPDGVMLDGPGGRLTGRPRKCWLLLGSGLRTRFE